jgi:hypothetical protein
MTISRAQMGTQLKGNRAMKKMKKYANGNMIDPDTPGVVNSLRPKLRPGDVPEGEPSSVGPSGGTRGPSPVLTPAMKRKRLEERLRREQMKRRATPAPAPAPAPAPMAPSAPPAGVMAGMDKPPMPMAKKGGKVKKMMGGGKVPGYKAGKSVRGAGMAKKGVRACKMR